MSVIRTHVFVFNPEENGGESISLRTNIISNGDPGSNGIYLGQSLTMMSYGNCTSMTLGCMTPERLRLLANELEREINKAITDKETLEKDKLENIFNDFNEG